VAEVKALNPTALYICDPVIGDQGAMYVKPELAKALAEILVPIADVLSPNVYELGHLTGREVTTRAQAVEALHALSQRSPARAIIGTGIPDPDHPDELAVLALARTSKADPGTISMAVTRRHPLFASGTGDAFAALFTARYLRDQDLKAAIEAAVAGMSHIVGETAATGSDELKIIETQDKWAAALGI
jgi:pyridoxine kinase